MKWSFFGEIIDVLSQSLLVVTPYSVVNVSEVHTASITLQMEAARTSEMLVPTTTLHGVTTRKTT
jgi:hypothetical protein